MNVYFAWMPDSLRLADGVGDEEGPTAFAGGSRAKKGKSGKTARLSPGSPEKGGSRGVGVRTRYQAQLEDKEDLVVKREPPEDVENEVLAKEDDKEKTNDKLEFGPAGYQ